jgi:hypothetical protein
LSRKDWFNDWINDRIARYPGRLEAIGFCLLVAAAMWRFIAEDLASGAQQLRYLTERLRLTEIWMALGSGDAPKYVHDHFDKFMENTPIIETYYRPAHVATWAQAALFIVGSFLIFMSKWAGDHA